MPTHPSKMEKAEPWCPEDSLKMIVDGVYDPKIIDLVDVVQFIRGENGRAVACRAGKIINLYRPFMLRLRQHHKELGWPWRTVYPC